MKSRTTAPPVQPLLDATEKYPAAANSSVLRRLAENIVSAAGNTCSTGACRIIAACIVSLAWMAVSSMLILVNKHILKDLHFPFPMTVASMGMASSTLFAYILCRVLRWASANTEITLEFYIRRIMPVGLCMALTLWTGNSVYLYLTVSLIQMLKSFTPVITLAMLAMAGLETPTCRMVGSVVGIAAGTALAAYGEVNMSFIGIMFALASTFTEASKLVMTQLLLVGLKMGPFEGVMYLSPACFFWLMVGSLLLEMPTILSSPELMAIPLQHAGLFTLAACLGFAVNSLTYATIKLASSLSLKVLGTVKNVFIIFAAMLMYDELVMPLQGIGYTISTIAFAGYTAVKMQQIADGTAATGGRDLSAPGAAPLLQQLPSSGGRPAGGMSPATSARVVPDSSGSESEEERATGNRPWRQSGSAGVV